ncbi:MAG: alpha/beta hydrolase [Undibacterium sp.]|uniref:RBBP9/YdeN family alpha/beta hydrolase n=1 Tax=Undibacterium sp. TaxID=1914977 RepID=UPI00272100D4|nr:alpha/beta hydrolase [Undibacterium sp.]MDO8652549.1 alpha/beta hydrolase [Undibacterium sp.]
MKILLLPGLYNSDPDHWQSRWERDLPNAIRVQQQSWTKPERHAWVASLTEAINAAEDEVVLVAHSLGCALVAWWVQMELHSLGDITKTKVKAALLVAPPDVARAGFPAPSFSPMPTNFLPFPAKMIVSDDDPWCELSVAKCWADAWGADFHCIGARGHINSESGLGGWEQGQHWLAELLGKL